MPKDNVFDPTEMQIIQDLDFDPIAILNGDQKLDSSKPIVKMPVAGDDSGNGGDGNDGDGDDGKPKPIVTPFGKKQEIELSDEMLEAGFKKTSGKKTNDGGNGGDGNEDGGDGKTGPDPVDKNNAFAVHYKMMVDSGEWEPLEGFDGTEEKYIEARNTNLEKQALGITNDWFAEAFKENPEGAAIGLQLFNHLRNGGKVADFVNVVAPTEFDFQEIHSEDDDIAEAASKEMIRNYYSAIGWKSQKISDKLANLSKTGQVIDEAKQIEEPYKELLDMQKNQELSRVQKQKEAKKQQAAVINSSINSMIEKNEGFGNIKLWTNPKEKKEFEEFIYKQTAEGKQTEFNEMLNAELKNPRFLTYLAASLKYKLYENTAAFNGSGDGAGQGSNASLKKTLEGALLNKDISKKDTSTIQNQNSNGSKYKFDLDNAVVIS